MKLNADLANKIVKEARSSINEHFIIADTNSIIIASSEPDRVGSFHEGAEQVISKKSMLSIHPEDVADLRGVKPGINMPITYNGDVIGVIGITGNPKDVRPFADLIRRLTELFIKEAIQTEQLNSRNRGIESFIYEWMHRETIDHSFEERGEILGIPVNNYYGVVLCRIEPLRYGHGQIDTISLAPIRDDSKILEKITMQREELHSKEDLIIRWGRDGFLLLIQEKRFSAERLRNHFEKCHQRLRKDAINLKVGIAKQTQKHILLPSFTEAQKALNSTTDENPIILYENLRLDILLQELSDEVRNAYLNATLQPIEKDHNLMDTLRMYLNKNMSITQAAEVLHVHINTLHYRLGKIKELTHLDIKTTEGIVLAGLAIRMLDEHKTTRGR